MIENLRICLNAVLPLFIYIVIGVMIRRTGMMNSEENKRMNRILFTFFYPVLLFGNIYSADLSVVFNAKLVVFAISFIVISVLVIVPMIGLPIAAMMGFRDVEFVTLLIMMASPTAVSSFPMAVAMDSDGEIAGSAVMISTPLSCITLFLWLLIFKTLGIY